MTEGKAQVVAVCDADAVFRVFTACPHDPKTLIIDVRDKKKWDRGHIAGSYCIRLPASGGTLLGRAACDGESLWQAAAGRSGPSAHRRGLPPLAGGAHRPPELGVKLTHRRCRSSAQAPSSMGLEVGGARLRA